MTGMELVVGLEVHCQLKTKTKLFCDCRTRFGDAPNANTCPVCLALPGALPVCNAHAVRLAVRAALALGCTVHQTSVFARKNYFYPDLPKGYQISQFDEPLATAGWLATGIAVDGAEACVRIHRVHMEEDAGKSVHDRFDGWTAIDLNRAGTPLIEIVSEPDIRSAAVAGAYLRRLKQILEYTEVSDANMEEGSLRVDVNVSVRPRGAMALGTKTEVKNLNSFSNAERAIEAEYRRQCAIIAAGGSVAQQTLLWDEHGGDVRPARSKEDSHDYRYFPDPDLPPLVVTSEVIAEVRDALPELPAAKRARFASDYALAAGDIEQLIATRRDADWFERLALASGDPRRAANWMSGPIMASANARGEMVADTDVTPERVGALVALEAGGRVSNSAARQLFPLLAGSDLDVESLAEREGLLLVSDDGELAGWIDAAFEAMPAETARFLAGERKLQGVLVGRVMKLSNGAADPKKVNQLLAARIPA